jgi:hypothetical protein
VRVKYAGRLSYATGREINWGENSRGWLFAARQKWLQSERATLEPRDETFVESFFVAYFAGARPPVCPAKQ